MARGVDEDIGIREKSAGWIEDLHREVRREGASTAPASSNLKPCEYVTGAVKVKGAIPPLITTS